MGVSVDAGQHLLYNRPTISLEQKSHQANHMWMTKSRTRQNQTDHRQIITTNALHNLAASVASFSLHLKLLNLDGISVSFGAAVLRDVLIVPIQRCEIDQGDK